MNDRNRYAERAMQRKQGNRAGQFQSKKTREQQLASQVRILADRLALALAVMTHHEELLRHSDILEWMKHLEAWTERLEEVEPAVSEGRERRFDHHRRQSLYRYHTTAIRALLRGQLEEDELGNVTDAADATRDA